MIFQHTIDLVLSGQKTQTRRIVKNGERPIYDRWQIKSIRAGRRLKWKVGKTYAVQPQRGAKGVARIELLEIRRQDVRDISDEDVLAEGFAGRDQFLNVWRQMHGDANGCWALTFRLCESSPLV